MKIPTSKTRVFQQPIGSAIKAQRSASMAALRLSVVLLAAVVLMVCSARANLLVNGNFNGGLVGWTTYTYGSGSYASVEIPQPLEGTSINPPVWPYGQPNSWPAGAGTNAAGTAPVYDGTLQLTCGATGGSAGGYAWQIVAGIPGVQYILKVQAGAQNWWLPTGEIRLWFLSDLTTNGIISSNFVETCLSINNPNTNPVVTLYDVGVPYQNWTNTAVAPAGTKYVKVELCNPNGTGSAWFDNADLTGPTNPPTIVNLYPDGTALMQYTNKLAFTAAGSAATINGSGIAVTVNGVNVTGSLVITGSGTTNVSVSYTGLQPNTLYTVAITVTDTANVTTIANVSFDTYNPSFTWEAEDYDYNSGQFINNPVLSSTPTAGSYFGVTGTEGIDYHDYSGDGPRAYRPDPMSTAVSGDIPRQDHVNAGVSDYIVGYFDGAGFLSTSDSVLFDGYESTEWVNYTRIFTNGTYNIYVRIANGNGSTATVPLSKVVSGQGTATQTTSPLGVFNFTDYGWGSYNYVPATDPFGNKVAVALSGTNTLRVSAGSGGNMNFFMLLAADTNTPTITGVYPDGSTLLQSTNKLAFTVSSASHSIAQSNVVVTLNGVTNNSLAFTGSASSWNVSVPLTLNVTNYTTVITVTDNAGNSHSTTAYFDTFNPASYDIEAVDWDFNGGQYIDNPVITSNAAPNSYFNVAGAPTDASMGDVTTAPTDPFRFRSADILSTDVCGDTPTRQLVAAQQTNALAFGYNIAYWATNSWANYTHTYPTNTFNVYGRLASANVLQVQLDQVTNGVTSYLGTFAETGRGWNLYDWVPLVNTNSGQLATVTLGGVATLRATSVAGTPNPKSYLLVPVVTAPALLNYSYSAGVLTLSWTNATFHLQVQTNALINGNWSNYPGGGASPVLISADKSLHTAFFRLSQ